MPASVLTVSALTGEIKELLRSQIGTVMVRGEISNFRRQSSGHCYFSLKDEGSQIAAAMFARSALGLDFTPRDGMEVVVRGEIDVYAPRGNYQLIVRSMAESGVGRLQEEFLRLKAKLEAEGLFAPERKRLLPRFPQTIALVTSPTGAALRDMISVFTRREWRGDLVLFPAMVQGEGSAVSVVGQLKRVAEVLPRCDLIILGRGGGSLEDLWTFNTEAVARAVAALEIPCISAVGHETDVVLTDFVADKRAETPTAAAELVTSEAVALRERTREQGDRLVRAVEVCVVAVAHSLSLAAERLAARAPERVIEGLYQRVDETERRLAELVDQRLRDRKERLAAVASHLRLVAPEARLRELHKELAQSSVQLNRLGAEHLRRYATVLESLAGRLESASLPKTLRRGFAVVQDRKGRVVRGSSELKAGDRIALRFAEGEAGAMVESVSSKP